MLVKCNCQGEGANSSFLKADSHSKRKKTSNKLLSDFFKILHK
jgi:hypothetical protein